MSRWTSGTPSAHWADDDRARHAIAEELVRYGEPLATQDELLRLQQEELLDAAEQGEVPYSELASIIREWRHGRSSGDAVIRERGDAADTDGHTAAPETGPRNRQPLMIPLGGRLPDEPRLARQHAVSRVLAASVSEELAIWERIVRFRQQQLGGSLLAWVAVDRWVTDHGASASSRAPSYWLSEVPVSQEQLDRGAKDAPVGYTTLSVKITVPLPSRRESRDEQTLGVGRAKPKALKYLRPGEVNPTWRYVAAGSALDDLRRLSEDLAPVDLFDRDADMTLRPWWTRAQATTFVLTGLAPYTETFGTMMLLIDPLLPLEQVMEQVAQARRTKVGERAREMSAKHLHLAVFGAERAEEPWSERLDAWNATYPVWAYSENRRSNFIRDSVVAKRRLLLQERQRQESDANVGE